MPLAGDRRQAAKAKSAIQLSRSAPVLVAARVVCSTCRISHCIQRATRGVGLQHCTQRRAHGQVEELRADGLDRRGHVLDERSESSAAESCIMRSRKGKDLGLAARRVHVADVDVDGARRAGGRQLHVDHRLGRAGDGRLLEDLAAHDRADLQRVTGLADEAALVRRRNRAARCNRRDWSAAGGARAVGRAARPNAVRDRRLDPIARSEPHWCERSVMLSPGVKAAAAGVWCARRSAGAGGRASPGGRTRLRRRAGRRSPGPFHRSQLQEAAALVDQPEFADGRGRRTLGVAERAPTMTPCSASPSCASTRT